MMPHMKYCMFLMFLACPVLAKDPPSIMRRTYEVWTPRDATSYEKSAYIERASCNHWIALPPEKVYKNWSKVAYLYQ